MEPNPHLVTPTDTRRISREDPPDREDAASSAGATALPHAESTSIGDQDASAGAMALSDTELKSSEDTSSSDDEIRRHILEEVLEFVTDERLEFVREEQRKRREEQRKRREVLRKHRAIPIEIRRMDNRSVEIFTNAVKTGTYNSYHIQITFVGHTGAGKTTLTMGLLRRKTEATTSTNGIDIFKEQCFYDKWFHEWIAEAPDFKPFSAEDILTLALNRKVSPGTPVTSEEETSSTNKSQQQTLVVHKQERDVQKDNFTKTNKRASDSVAEKITHTSLSSMAEEKRSQENQRQTHGVDLLKRIVTRDQYIPSKNGDLVPVDFWDFGGQVVFYTSHQAFLSHRSIYILPIDLSLPLHHFLVDNNLDPSDPGASSIKAFLSYWINTLITFANGGLEGQPKIIIVGTKLDKVAEDKQEETVMTTIRFIEDEYKDLISSSQMIVNKMLVMDARDVDDPAYDILRQTISQVAEEQPYWGEERPSKWLPVQEKILERKEKGDKICTLDEVRKMNETCMITVQEEELKVILRFMHSLGILLYFNDPGLDDHIILDPQWIANVLKTFITHKSFAQPNQIQAFEQLEKKGTIEREMIDQIWRQPDNEVMRKHQDYLLKALENLDLISTPKSYTEDGEISSLSFYFVPSMLTGEPQKDISCFPKIGTYIRFEFKKFLPLAIYNRLTAACLATWVVKDDCLFSGLCVFVIDAVHLLAIRKTEANITACVSHERRVPANNSVCFGVQTFLESTLRRIVSLYQTEATGNQYGEDEKHEVFTVDGVQYNPKTEEEVEDCQSSCRGLPKEELLKPPTHQELCRLSKLLPLKIFTQVGSYLSIPDNDLEDIQDLRSRRRDQYFEIFRTWQNKTRESECTIQHLLAALSRTEEIGRPEHLFCKIHRMMHCDIDSMELPIDLKNQVPSDRVLEATSTIMSNEYFQVAMELGFEYSKLTVIENNNKRDVVGVVRSMLREWKKDSQYRPTALILAKTLKSNKCDYKHFCQLMRKDK